MDRIKSLLHEEGAKQIVAALVVPPIVLLAIIWSEVGLPFWQLLDSRITKKSIWATLGLAIWLIGIVSAYTLHLRKKYNPKLFDAFGIKWSNNLKPYCPKCAKLLGYSEEDRTPAVVKYTNPLEQNKPQRNMQQQESTRTPMFHCIHCKEHFPPQDEDGRPITRAEAISRLKELRT